MTSVRRPKDKRWVEAFYITHSKDGEKWHHYKDKDGRQRVLSILL